MTRRYRHEQLDDAFDRMEATLLPDIARILDALIDASARRDAPAARAWDLKEIARQLDQLSLEMQAIERVCLPSPAAVLARTNPSMQEG